MQGRVAVWLAPHAPFEFREYPVADPRPDCILVRMRVCNICGSDLHLWHGDAANLSAGQVLGHEMVGTIEKLGNEVTADSLGRPQTVVLVNRRQWRGDRLACRDPSPFPPTLLCKCRPSSTSRSACSYPSGCVRRPRRCHRSARWRRRHADLPAIGR